MLRSLLPYICIIIDGGPALYAALHVLLTGRRLLTAYAMHMHGSETTAAVSTSISV